MIIKHSYNFQYTHKNKRNKIKICCPINIWTTNEISCVMHAFSMIEAEQKSNSALIVK